MKKTEIICWAKASHDLRDTASATLTYMLIGKMSAVAIARMVDEEGSGAVRRLFDTGELRPAPHNKTEHRPACHHGVSIVYPSGRTRTVRAR